jgi:hypothetical protein
MILGGCRRGGAAPRGGMVGEVEGYLWTRRQSADATREEAAGAGWGSNAEVEVVCGATYVHIFLGEASKIWEVGRKLVGSR